jgi:hypothetical protein
MRRVLAAFAAAATLAALASLAPTPAVAPACAGSGPHRAAVVLEHGDGSVTTRCVAFDGGQISGEALLDRSGIAWSGQTFGGFGQAVCALDGEPARYADCPGRDRYWVVFVARGVAGGGSWQLSNVGVSGLVLHDGDAEGFRYVPVSGTPAEPPSPAGICADASKSARATAPPTRAPAVSASAVSSDSAAASASTAALPSDEVAAATSTPETSAAPVASPGGESPPAPSGPDPGLMAAAAAGGGLAGLAILRRAAGRRARR